MTNAERKAIHDLGNEQQTVSMLLHLLEQWQKDWPNPPQSLIRQTNAAITIGRNQGRI